jgi:hypothetical protein
MKVTLVIEADPENLAEVAHNAVNIVVNGGAEGTYGFPGKGECSLWHWPVGDADECPSCCGSGFIVGG